MTKKRDALEEAKARIAAVVKEGSDWAVLKLDGLGLEELPVELWRTDGFDVLDLSDNALEELPAAIGKLQRLERLVLSNNKLTALPEEVKLLRKLTTLYLDGNDLAEVPPSIQPLEKLSVLALDGNDRITTAPPWLSDELREDCGLDLDFGGEQWEPHDDDEVSLEEVIEQTGWTRDAANRYLGAIEPLRQYMHQEAVVEYRGSRATLALFSWPDIDAVNPDADYPYSEQILYEQLGASARAQVKAGRWAPLAVVGLLGWTWRYGGFEELGTRGVLLIDLADGAVYYDRREGKGTPERIADDINDLSISFAE
jgi:hypothetical protein